MFQGPKDSIVSQIIKIFTDGACSGNPGKGGWGAVLSFPDGRVEEIGGGKEETTNNQMELKAALCALERVAERQLPSTQIELYTDSKYLIEGMQKWSKRWKQNNWQTKTNTEVKNKELWEGLLQKQQSLQIDWKHVPGHQGIGANERCDKIAVYFSQGKNIKLYKGPISTYPIDLEVLPQKAPPGFTLPYYLSYTNGELQRHQSWEECSKKVQGVSNAKYRKCRSTQEEQEICKNWGVK